MKAIICKKYGGPEVLKLEEVAKPIPDYNEVCVKIHATAVTNSDIFIRGSKLPFPIIIPFRLMIGFFKPRKSIIGLVFSGEIESIGKNIKRFKPGDNVYGLTGFGLGTYAEFMCMKESDSKSGCIAIKPGNISHEEATMAAYGGLLAFQYLEKGNIQKGTKGPYIWSFRGIWYISYTNCKAFGRRSYWCLQYFKFGNGQKPGG